MRIEWSEPAMQDMAALRDPIASDFSSRSRLFIHRLSELGRMVRETDATGIRDPLFIDIAWPLVLWRR